MTLPVEIEIKEERLRRFLDEQGYDSLIVARRDNIAWLTGGGEAVSDRMSPYSPLYLVVTPDAKYAVGYTMDLPRTMDDEFAGLDYEPRSIPTFGRAIEAIALELAVGRPCADVPFLGVDDVSEQIVDLYWPYTPAEMARYEANARQCAAILTELGNWVEPGMTERQAFARMWGLFVEHGFSGRYMWVGSDERIAKYRHPVPSDEPIENVVLFAPTAVKGGLPVLLTRMVTFGDPPEDIRRRYDAVTTMQAAMLSKTQPGARLKPLFDAMMGLFEEMGYPADRTRHFHGGPVHYGGSDSARMQDPDAVVQANSSYTYYLTITGVKSEDLILVDDERTWLASVDGQWPMRSVKVDGQTYGIPDLLIR